MKKTIVIFTLFALLFQNFGKAAILVDYIVNKNYIASNLCENKAKPKMNCAGKCHLKRQLKKQNKKEQSSPFKNLKEKEIVQQCSESNVFCFFNSIPVKPSLPLYAGLKSSGIVFGIFHPPRL